MCAGWGNEMQIKSPNLTPTKTPKDRILIDGVAGRSKIDTFIRRVIAYSEILHPVCSNGLPYCSRVLPFVGSCSVSWPSDTLVTNLAYFSMLTGMVLW